jgi:hypothetical protein
MPKVGGTRSYAVGRRRNSAAGSGNGSDVLATPCVASTANLAYSQLIRMPRFVELPALTHVGQAVGRECFLRT